MEQQPKIRKKRVFRIKWEKYFHGKQTVTPRFLLSLSYTPELQYNFCRKRPAKYKKMTLATVLKKSAKNNGVRTYEKKELLPFANKRINTFFLTLEKEMTNNDVVFKFPEGIMYLFLTYVDWNGRTIKDIKKVKLYQKFVIRVKSKTRETEGYVFPYAPFYGWINKSFEKNLKIAQQQGRRFYRFPDIINYLKGELKYDQQLQIYHPRSSSLRAVTDKQK